jgi:anaerobic selenocysteine-containing dehydrogenase
MVVTRTGVSMHLAGTVAEWLGHVLNVITGRMDRPGGRRYEPGYVDAVGLSAMIKAKPHSSRLRGRQMVAGAHALSELPDEITTAGAGQIRAMVINCGNPVVSGPDGAKSTVHSNSWTCWWPSTSCSAKAIGMRTGCCLPCTGWNATTSRVHQQHA